MKITIEPTSKVVELNGVPARIWEGSACLEEHHGVPCHVFVTRIAVSETESEEVHTKFREALQETKAPTPDVESYPLKMVL